MKKMPIFLKLIMTLLISMGGALGLFSMPVIYAAEPPVIVTHPESVKALYGTTVTLNAEATGSNIKYQWQYKGNIKNATWTNISNTTNTYSVIAELNHGYQYRCLISDDTYSGESAIPTNAANIHVIKEQVCRVQYITDTPTAPIITKQPESAQVAMGMAATFEVTAVGDNLSYKWQFKTPQGSWTDATNSQGSGYTTNRFTTIATTYDMSCYEYRCVVSDNDGYYISAENAVLSDSATLMVISDEYTKVVYVNDDYSITKQPQTVFVNEGDSAVFTVEASRNVDITYRWLYKASGENSSWTEVPSSMGAGMQSAKLTISEALEEYNGYMFRCSVGGAIYSYETSKLTDAAHLLISEPEPKITAYLNNPAAVDINKAMITEWTITTPGTTITLPIRGETNVYVEWGDGNIERIKGTITVDSMPTHTYTDAGVYYIKISGTTGEWGISEYNATTPYESYRASLTGVKQWGELGVTNYGFSYCKLLKYVDANCTEKTFENVTNMKYMFRLCSGLERIDCTNWDTSNVTNMDRMFVYCSSLTSLDLNGVDTSKVTNMEKMFYGCKSIKNLDLRSFDTSMVTKMADMFGAAPVLEKIVVSKDFVVTNVPANTSMFENDPKLVGGAGTVYDKNRYDVSMAHIDTVANPGYFTEAQYEVTYEDGTVDDSLQTMKMAVKAIANSESKSGTITPIANTIDDVQAVIPADTTVTLDLNGKTITVLDMSNGSFIENNGTLNVKDTAGAIDYTGATEAYVIENNGTLNVGTNDNTIGTSAPVIKGGTHAVYGNVETTNLYDGVFKGTVASIGGEYTLSDGYAMKTVEETIDGTTYYKETLDVGSYMVGSDYYYSLKAAIDAIETEGTIIVCQNNTDTYLAKVPKGKIITLDLNGKTITKTTNYIEVLEGALTITDSTSTPGTITSAGVDSDTLTLIYQTSGDLNLEKGNYYQHAINSGASIVEKTGGCVYVRDVTMTSEEDVIVSNDANIYVGNPDDNVTINTPTIIAARRTIEAISKWHWYDGTLKSKQSDIYTDGPEIPLYYEVERGEETIGGETYYTACLIKEENYEINGNNYSSMAEAIAANPNGGTIKVLRDCTDPEEAIFPADQSYILDVGEYYLTKEDYGIIVEGNLEIKGGSSANICGYYIKSFLIENKGTTTLSGSINIDSSQVKCEPKTTIYTTGTLNIMDDVEIWGEEKSVYNDGTFNFEGGLIKAVQPAKPFGGNGTITTPENKSVYYYTEDRYNCASLKTGWDISKDGDGRIYAYLIENGSDYTLDVIGTGVTKAYGWTDDTRAPWYEYRNNIIDIKISEGIEIINQYTFAYLPKIKKIVLPTTLITLGTCAFSGATGVTETITIPANLKSLMGNPFPEVPITNMVVESGNTEFKVSNDMLMSMDGTRVITYFMGKEDERIEVPEGVTTLAAHSFRKMKAKEIILPSTLVKIDIQALAHANINELVIPESVSDLRSGFVMRAANLENIYFMGTDFTLDGTNHFANIKSGSAIYTRSAEMVSKFGEGTQYDTSLTTIYYPPVISGTLLDTTVNSMQTVTYEVAPTAGVPATTKYIWEVKRVGTDSWVPLMDGQGLNTAKYTTSQLTVANSGDEYRCTINSIDGKGTTIYPNTYMPLTDADMAEKLISDTGKVFVKPANYEVNGEFFATLEEAVAAVPANIQTTINLTTNLEDNSPVTIPADRNVILNIDSFTLNRKDEKLINNGILDITGTGTLKVESATLVDNKGTLKIDQDAINVISTSTSAVAIINSGSVELNKLSLTTVYTALENTSGAVKISGGTFIASGDVEVTEFSGWSFDGGTVEILGGTFNVVNRSETVIGMNVENSAVVTMSAGNLISTGIGVRSQASSTFTITSGTISANVGIENYGTDANVVIGQNDSSVYKDSITITGAEYGYYANDIGNLSFFDGTIKGKKKAVISNVDIITPDGYNLNYSTQERIYECATLVRANYHLQGSGWFDTLNAVFKEVKDGVKDWLIINIYVGENITSLTEVEETIIDVNTEFTNEVNLYLTNGAAIDFEKTITVSSGTVFNVINSGDLGAINANITNNGTLDFKANLIGTLTNNGTATIGATSGTLVNTVSGNVANTGTMTINKTTVTDTVTSSGGALTLNGGELNGGVTISGGSKFTMTSGTINNSNGVAVTNSGTGEIEIKSGTITGATYGIENISTGVITIGNLINGVISSGDPIITGGTYGVNTQAAFSFYDGMLRGETAAYSGTVITIEDGTHIKKDTPTKNGTNYHRAYIEDNDTYVEVWDISKTAGADEVYAGVKVVEGDGVNADTRYKLVVWGTGATKDYEYRWSESDSKYESTTPWYDIYGLKIIELNLEDGVTRYGNALFAALLNVTSNITFPNTLMALGDRVFECDSNITGGVEITENLGEIGNANPFGATGIETFTVVQGNTMFEVKNEGLYHIESNRLIAYPNGSSTTEPIVAEGTLVIGACAFYKNKNIETILLPDSLKKIEVSAFDRTSLKEIIIPASVTDIDAYAFTYTSSLKNVYLKAPELTLYGLGQFTEMAANSIIYTTSKKVADLFVAETTYTAANTSIYYPPVISGTLLDRKVNNTDTTTFEVTSTPGVPATTKYIWEVKRVGSDSWEILTDGQGLNTAKYTTSQLTVANSGDEYRCTINSIDGNGTTIYPNTYMPLTDADMAEKLISDTGKVFVQLPNYEVNGEFFATLEEAVAVVPANTQTTINLTTNLEDNSPVTIPADRNVILNIDSFTLNRKDEKLINNGILDITGTGTLKVESATLVDNKGTLKIDQDAINVISTSTSAVAIINSGSVELNKLSLTTAYTALENTSGAVKISGGTFIASGDVEVTEFSGWSFDGGTVEILGGTFNVVNRSETVIGMNVENSAVVTMSAGNLISTGIGVRAQTSSTFTITSGTISANVGIENYGTNANVVIGQNDASIYKDSITVTGAEYGYYANDIGNLSFFDGTIKGKKKAVIINVDIITPDGYNLNYSTQERIYECATLVRANYRLEGSGWFDTLNAVLKEVKDGVKEWISINIYVGENITSLTEVEETIIDVNTEFTNEVNLYLTNGAAIDFEKTITVSSGTVFNVINSGDLGAINANITNNGTLDFKANLIGTLTNNGTATIGATSGTLVNTVSGNVANTGTMKINKTTVTDTVTSSGGALTLNGGELNGGVTISGGSKFTMTSGTINNSNGVAVTNSGTGEIEIKSGTITGATYGIENISTGAITIGNLINGVISSGDPIITGGTYGVNTQADFIFYDGMLRGETAAYSGTVTTIEDGTHIKKDTPTENGTNYHRAYIVGNNEFVEVWDISKTPGTDEVYAGVKVVEGDGINADTRYKLVVWGTGATKDYTFDIETWRPDTPWFNNYATKIITLELEDGVTRYGASLFALLTNVNSELVIPDSLTSLGSRVFQDDVGITGNIKISKNLISITENPFMGTNIESFEVDADNTVYTVQNEGLYQNVPLKLVAHPNGSTTTKPIVAEGTKEIGAAAFWRNQNIETVIIPNTVTTISNSAIDGTSIKEITIPESVIWFGDYAVSSPQLSRVYLKSTRVEFINNRQFYNLAADSIIYTESKEIADLFIPGTTYTAANTSIYYPFKVEMPEDFEVEVNAYMEIEPNIRDGNPNDVVYQWYLNGKPIDGANSATYSKDKAGPLDSGDYQVLIESALQEDGTYYYSHMSEKTNMRVKDCVAPESVTISVTYADDANGVGYAKVKVTASDSYSGVEKFYVNGTELTTGVTIINDGTGLNGGTGVAEFDITTKGTYLISVADAEDNRKNNTLNAYLIEYLPGSNHQVTGETKSQIAIEDIILRIRMCNFTKVGHTFLNWKDEKGYEYDLDFNGAIWFSKDTKFTAQWEANTYKVEFYIDAGEGPVFVESGEYSYEEIISVPDKQSHVAEMDGTDKYKIYRHNNDWKATTLDSNSVFKAVDISTENKDSIKMVDSNVRYDARYEITTYDVGNATVYLDGAMNVSGDVSIKNDEGVVFIGTLPTIYGPVYNNNGLVFDNR